MERRALRARDERRGGDGWLGGLLWITLIFLVAGTALVIGSGGFAQTTGTATTLTFQTGQVTAVGKTTIRINAREYSLSSEVVIRDDEGKPRELKDLTPGSDVKFHVKRDSIDQIILLLPR
ncbi:MAG: hypothetical protein AB1411_09085 [Nitrospirota bacterium]